uniref:Glycosyltransferase n=1 Tax=viral metagenome TaxID=1070528 RepID=A0A6M3LST1_9ZZZZ
MKAYFYTDDEVGQPWLGPDADRLTHEDFEPFPDPRFNWCAFPSFEPTEDPQEADIFVMRQRLSKVGEIDHLPHLKGNEERHVFFDLADNYKTYPGIDALYLRGAAVQQVFDVNPTTVSWPWPTEDFGRFMSTPAGGWQYDVSFQGQASDMARVAMQSCIDAGLGCAFHINDRFWPHICEDNDRVGERLRRTFSENMQGGRLSLCPTTLTQGVIRYRLYEAMSMGRVSIHICDGGVLPMQDKIDWDRCVVHIAEADAANAGPIIKAWLDRHSDAEIWDMGLYAREMWVKWLWRGTWAENVDLVVRERLGLDD